MREAATTYISGSLQVPFAIVSPKAQESGLGPEVGTTQKQPGDKAFTYIVGKVKTGESVDVVIGYNGSDHFSPTVSIGK